MEIILAQDSLVTVRLLDIFVEVMQDVFTDTWTKRSMLLLLGVPNPLTTLGRSKNFSYSKSLAAATNEQL